MTEPNHPGPRPLSVVLAHVCFAVTLLLPGASYFWRQPPELMAGAADLAFGVAAMILCYWRPMAGLALLGWFVFNLGASLFRWEFLREDKRTVVVVALVALVASFWLSNRPAARRWRDARDGGSGEEEEPEQEEDARREE